MKDFKLDEDFDFGFTTHSDQEFTGAVTAAQDKAQAMYNAIMPLLNNLAKDADKNDVIKWPNRKDRIEKFIKQLQSILNS